MNYEIPALIHRDVTTRCRFELIVDEALENLPPWILERVDNLQVVVEKWPSTEQDPEGLGILGIYEGVSLPNRSSSYFGAIPDRITIFSGPHLKLGLNGASLKKAIHRTILHEIAHHFGIDDDRLSELGYS